MSKQTNQITLLKVKSSTFNNIFHSLCMKNCDFSRYSLLFQHSSHLCRKGLTGLIKLQERYTKPLVTIDFCVKS